jgi:hypothetical protein
VNGRVKDNSVRRETQKFIWYEKASSKLPEYEMSEMATSNTVTMITQIIARVEKDAGKHVILQYSQRRINILPKARYTPSNVDPL